MNYKKINDEVYYSPEAISTIKAEDLDYLKGLALKNPRQRVRLCTHKEVTDKVHEMFIIHTKDAYVRPHKHINKSESFYLIEGEVDVIFFDDNGEIIKRIEMGALDSGKFFYYRLTEPFYHTLCIKTDLICFYEVTEGPFNRLDTVFPSWAPDGSNAKQVKEFLNKLF